MPWETSWRLHHTLLGVRSCYLTGALSPDYNPREETAGTISAWRITSGKDGSVVLRWGTGVGEGTRHPSWSLVPPLPSRPLVSQGKGPLFLLILPPSAPTCAPPPQRSELAFIRDKLFYSPWEIWLREQKPSAEGTWWRQLIPLKY